MLIKDEIAVVVRSAGERTTEACFFLLKQIFAKENIAILKSMPFSKAIADGFEIGRKLNKRWILCIDADVLVSPAGIEDLLNAAVHCDENVFELQGLVLDKFIPVLRPAGNHLYRTELTVKAVNMIPTDGASLRPESDMLNSMDVAGHTWMQCNAVVGIHDFEQFNLDIFGKCFLQAHKHSQVLTLVEQFWLEKSTGDLDFKVALWGVLSGKLYRGTILVDRRFGHDEASRMLSALGVEEKGVFEPFPKLTDHVNEMLESYISAIDPLLQEKIFPKIKWSRLRSNDRTPPKVAEDIFRRVQYKLGDIFIQLGRKLKHHIKIAQ